MGVNAQTIEAAVKAAEEKALAVIGGLEEKARQAALAETTALAAKVALLEERLLALEGQLAAPTASRSTTAGARTAKATGTANS